jgi:hypothetical protein
VVQDVAKLRPPEDTLRDGEEHYDRLVRLSTDAVIKHASGGFPSADMAGAKLPSPSGGVAQQTSSELCTSLPPGGGEVRTYVWQERKKTRTYWETRPW